MIEGKVAVFVGAVFGVGRIFVAIIVGNNVGGGGDGFLDRPETRDRGTSD